MSSLGTDGESSESTPSVYALAVTQPLARLHASLAPLSLGASWNNGRHENAWMIEYTREDAPGVPPHKLPLCSPSSAAVGLSPSAPCRHVRSQLFPCPRDDDRLRHRGWQPRQLQHGKPQAPKVRPRASEMPAAQLVRRL